MSTSPDHPAAKEACARILASRTFQDAPRLLRFLQYVAGLTLDGRPEAIKEYTLGLDVFERPITFDPKTDPIVRVQAGRLRLKLLEYYDQEGRDDPVRVEIPKGTYIPVFHLRPPSAAIPIGAMPPENSIAVLPFAAISPEPEIAAFADGLTEEVIHALAGVEGYKVVSRTSAFAFRNVAEDVRQIGSRLQAASIVEGSIRSANGAIRVTVQLVRAADGYHRWSLTYDVNPADAGAQRRIAHEIQRAMETGPRKHAPALKWVIAAAVLVTSSAWMVSYSRDPSPLKASKLTRLTSSGATFNFHTLSADGRFLAYGSNEHDRGRTDLSVMDMASGSVVRVPYDGGHVGSASFSPDGKSLAVSTVPRPGTTGDKPRIPSLFVMPILGGPGQKLADDVGLLRYSPGGEWIAFFRTNPPRIFVLPTKGGEPRQLAADFAEARNPIWVDGRHVLFLGAHTGKEPILERLDWWVTPLDGGPVIRTGAYARLREPVIDEKRTILIAPYAWHRGNVIFSARIGENANIWSLPISERSWRATGPPQRITFGTGLELGPAVSPSGKLVFVSDQRTTNLFSFPMNPAKEPVGGEPRQLTRNSVFNWGQNVSRDGKRLAYISNRSGDWELWTRDLVSDQETLMYRSTGPTKLLAPKFSPDATQIAFHMSSTSDTGEVRVMPASGGSPRPLCSACGPPAGWTPDGGKVVIRGGDLQAKSSTWQVAMLDVNSGTVQRAEAPRSGLKPVSISSDGNRLVVEIMSGVVGADGIERAVVPFRDGKIGPEKEWIPLGSGTGSAEWSSDGSLLYYQSGADGHPCIWAQRFDIRTDRPEGKPFPSVHFHDRNRQPAQPLNDFLAVTPSALIVTVSQTSAELWMAQLR